FSNRWLTTVLIDPEVTGLTRENVRLSLAAENIESRPVWKPMHQQPVFGHSKYYGNGISCKLFEQGLCLPSGSNLKGKDRARIADTLHETILCKV
ncbi:MAG: DegT/DnrJ/EryC1/StrS family aminotransferase, partial [Cyclonatronaceae bacterium]